VRNGAASMEYVARGFVEARLAAKSLPDYPGVLPPDLDTAYRIQDAAIALWPDEIKGWKIGRIAPQFEGRFGRNRLAGPIFREMVRPATSPMPTPFPVFDGGFAAIEAEFVIAISADAAPEKKQWTTEEARALVGEIHIGVETAGSPLATINLLGPTAVVSDFGNNAGLILGGIVPDWRTRIDREFACESFIDECSVGRGSAADLPGGPIESLRFVLELSARRGLPLKKGMLVSTGAATGIHEISAGHHGRVVFADVGALECIAVAATKETPTDKAKAASKVRQGEMEWINPRSYDETK
jgi:2-keto-4-pentenoate hydratase